MKRISTILLSVALICCDRHEAPAPPAGSSKPAPVQSAKAAGSEPGDSADKTLAGRSRNSLTAAEFHSDLALAGMSPEQPRVRSSKVVGHMAEQLHFTRVVGGQNRYCGALSSGPIRCWGKNPKLIPGSFGDVALGEAGYCGVDLNGQLSCENLTPPEGSYSRVVASGQNYCALGKRGDVACFGSSGTAAQPNQRAQFVTAGRRFACAADPTERLVCWGHEAPLLPIDPVRVKEIAAGARFFCFLNEGGEVRCLGQGPRLKERRYAALNAGYETVCGITTDGAGYCAGKVEMQTAGPVRQFAVGESSVCAHRQDGRIECWGDATDEQLKVPTATDTDLSVPAVPKEETERRVDPALWLEFIDLFPPQEVPLVFDEKATISLSDRVPAKFEPLVSGDPNQFRSGVGIKLGHDILGLTLFDVEGRVLLLYLYRERTLLGAHELLRWDQGNEPVKEKPDGTAEGRGDASALRSLITTTETIEVASFKGEEQVFYVKSTRMVLVPCREHAARSKRQATYFAFYQTANSVAKTLK